jgi:hypothetical protein
VSRRSDQHILQVTWPGSPEAPFATVRPLGQGRVVYVSADLAAAAHRYGDADTLAFLVAAVRGASSIPPPVIAENIPPSVEIALHEGPRGLTMILVNQTCNQHLADPVRCVVPLHNLRLDVNCGDKKVHDVKTLTGAEIEWRKHGVAV